MVFEFGLIQKFENYKKWVSGKSFCINLYKIDRKSTLFNFGSIQYKDLKCIEKTDDSYRSCINSIHMFHTTINSQISCEASKKTNKLGIIKMTCMTKSEKNEDKTM